MGRIDDQGGKNPAILVEGNQVKLLYRDAGLRIFMALFQNYKGLYRVVNENVWPECKLEDFYLFKSEELYHIMCEDNVGGVSGHERWGVRLYSKDGITN